MPKNPNVKRVMVIGSGPIVIGQAAEFDYAGTQACRSLKEEGVEVILVNSNPATIMTDRDIADKVYIEPLTLKVLEQIIEKEKPDSILPLPLLHIQKPPLQNQAFPWALTAFRWAPYPTPHRLFSRFPGPLFSHWQFRLQ